MLAWLTIAVFFITLAIIIKGFERYSIYFSIGFLVTGIIVLVISNIDYLNDRRLITASGLTVRPRMDALFVIVLIAIIISTFMLYDIIRYEVPSSWDFKKEGAKVKTFY